LIKLVVLSIFREETVISNEFILKCFKIVSPKNTCSLNILLFE